MAEISKAREHEAKIDTRHDNDSQGGLQIGGETREDMKDVHDLHTNVREQFSLEEHVSMLNDDQSCIFEQVTQYLCHQKQHETGNCAEATSNVHKLCVVGRTGKSFLIETIRANWVRSGTGLRPLPVRSLHLLGWLQSMLVV